MHTSDQIRENELAFITLLIHDGIIAFDKQQLKYKPQGQIAHVLAAAASKKRSMLTNLRHERLHIYWDQDPSMQQKYIALAQKLSPKEQEQAFKHLINYNQDNIAQLIEEWAVGQAEKDPLKQRSEI